MKKVSPDFVLDFTMLNLEKDFFNRSALVVAPELLGKTIHAFGKQSTIIETEAYLGKEDPASHAFKGPTPRSKIMFGPTGRLYVYLIYGIHHCMNIVCHEPNGVGAVLIRGLVFENDLILGPGKCCKLLNITREHNHFDLTLSQDIYINNQAANHDYIQTPRIGIRNGTELLWRYCSKKAL